MNLKKPIKVRFLKEAETYFLAQKEKTQKKFLLAFEKTEAGMKGDWFEKHKNTDGIYEFRQSDHQKFYRMFAFWDSEEKETLIVVTHGVDKKSNKTPLKEIKKAEQLKKRYLETKKKKMKTIGLSELKDKSLGKIGTSKRDKYEYELRVEFLSEQIKELRKERNLTQEQLGKLIGVQRAQISKLENNTSNVTIGTILKVFNALKATVNFRVEKQELITV